MLMKVMMRGDEASQCNELWNELKNMMYDVINALCPLSHSCQGRCLFTSVSHLMFSMFNCPDNDLIRCD